MKGTCIIPMAALLATLLSGCITGHIKAEQAVMGWVDTMMKTIGGTPPPAPPLHQAVLDGNSAGVRERLDCGDAIDERDARERTALHIAASTGNSDIVHLLLDRGANPNALDRNDRTPLHLAAGKARSDCVNVLTQRGSDIIAEDTDGFTPLHLSAYDGHQRCVTLLLNCGADPNARNGNGDTALHLVAIQGHYKIAVLLLDRGATCTPGTAGRTPLHHSILCGHETLSRELIARGADVNAPDAQGLTPLHMACASEQAATLALLLLRHGADTGAASLIGLTPLHLAAVLGQEETCRRLLRAGADPNARTTHDVTPPILDAKRDAILYPDATEKILETSATEILEIFNSTNGPAGCGETPLHCAAVRPDLTIYRLLVSYGAEPGARNGKGLTPLEIYAKRREYAVSVATPAHKAFLTGILLDEKGNES